MKNKDRLAAFKILLALIEHESSLSQQLHPSADLSALTKEICFGVCRHFFRLTAIADCLLNKRPKSTEVWIVVLMGLYQLHYMNQADYAVVKETVDILETIKKTWAKGLVNAVLRNFCRHFANILPKLNQDPAFLYGQAPWFLESLQTNWPNDWQQIAAANDAHPPMTLRVNQKINSRDDYLKQLTDLGFKAKAHEIASAGILLETPCDVYSLPGFEEGCVSVQDGAAQLAVSLLTLEPGLRLLDACCAPGGKTCHILESQSQLMDCVALDVHASRLKRVQDNLKRLKLKATLLQGDAQTPEIWWDGRLFNRILLDAPCSATGVIRRHSDIKLLRCQKDVFVLTQLQEKLLDSLWPLLVPGGLMVYATCSVMPDENELQIRHFLQKHPDCQVLEGHYPWGRPTGHGRQILPGEQEMDGFFYSVLVKMLK